MSVETPQAQAPQSPESPVEQPQPSRWGGALREMMASNATVIVFAIVGALLMAAVLIAAANSEVQRTAGYIFARPSDFFSAVWNSVSSAYSSLFRGAVYDPQANTFARQFKPITETLTAATPLIFAGLGLGVGFRSGIFNIGAQGQVILGAVVSAFFGFAFSLPLGLHLLVAVLGGALAGGLWAGIAGFLKARFGANEVIVTIMLNSIAGFLMSYLLTTQAFMRPGSNNPVSQRVYDTAMFPSLMGDNFRLHWGFILALVAAYGVWWLMERSTLGFKFRAVGFNPDAARTAGIKVERMYLYVMLLAGGLAGMGGVSQTLGTEGVLQEGVAGNIGFDAITVALLGRSKPVGIIGAAILFGALRAGSPLMQTASGTPIDIVQVVQALVVLLIAAPPLVRAIFRLPVPVKENAA
ncbi:ABC transporter permease [Populibacterium corticicola]|uniref:ABC transporter permease n=1 Tax=Populibacterium corticicola TaxID=1812826 RepID=A0ABW5XGE4_9MICO